jgi:sucrose phosphorylase
LLTEYHVIKAEYFEQAEKKTRLKAFLGKYNPGKYRVITKKDGKKDIIIEGTPESKKIKMEKKIIPAKVAFLGGGKVWTTFSRAQKDGIEETRQVDLNYSNPNVFVESLIIALSYLERGASFLRLDAIGYLWKEIGASCIHEEKTHKIIQAVQAVLKEAAPGVITVAEVNEPQEEAFKYIGSIKNPEADMAYQFVHFPLAVYSVLTGNAGYYREWIDTIVEYGVKQFLLVFGSHDGMGLKPVMNILPADELRKMEIILVDKFGARPNKARLSTGEEITYEICATPWNLINNPDSGEALRLQLKRYVAVAMMGMAHRALRAFYINSYIGAANYTKELDENRTINRERFEESKLIAELDDPSNPKSIIMHTLNTIIGRCTHQAAFDPHGPAIRTMETGNDALLAEVLETPDKDDSEKIIQLINVSGREVSLEFAIGKESGADKLFEIFSGKNKVYTIKDGAIYITLEPYDVFWFKEKDE